MSVLIKNMEMPKGCIYANDNDQTEYCPLLNHDDVPFCQYIESEPEIAIGIDERPVYCPLSDVPEPCENTVSRQAVIDAAMQYCPDDDGSCSKADRDIRELLDDIENLPSAQPEPLTVNFAREMDRETIEKLKEGLKNAPVLIMAVNDSAQPERKKGEWIKMPYHVTECSECGFSLEDWIQGAFYNFCPNCGADMRPEYEEPEINPCRGCADYDGRGGCKSDGGCGADMKGEQHVPDE